MDSGQKRQKQMKKDSGQCFLLFTVHCFCCPLFLYFYLSAVPVSSRFLAGDSDVNEGLVREKFPPRLAAEALGKK